MSTDTLKRNVDPKLGSPPRSTDRQDEPSVYLAAAQPPSTATTLQGPGLPGARHFFRHFIEMFVAMMVGMMVLGGADGAILSAAGTSVRHVRDAAPEVFALVMALNMTVGMTVWMRYRRHSWAMCAEMGGAMFLRAIAAVVLFWCSAIHARSVGGVEMGAMLPAMLAVMLFRGSEYSQPVHSHRAWPPATAKAGTQSHGRPKSHL